MSDTDDQQAREARRRRRAAQTERRRHGRAAAHRLKQQWLRGQSPRGELTGSVR